MTIFMDQLHPINWCNCVLCKLCIIDCNTVESLSCARAHCEFNTKLHEAQMSNFHQVTLETLSQELFPGLPGTDNIDGNWDFHLGGH